MHSVIQFVIRAVASLAGTAVIVVTQSATADAATASAPVITDTAYEIPADSVYVSPAGDDSNDGSANKPYKTLSAAIAASSSGATIVMRGGTYRESVGSVSTRLTIQPYPHEKVWIKGSRIITDWERSGHAWKMADRVAPFDDAGYNAGMIDPEHPLAGHPQMVFVDGHGLKQVGTLAQVSDGSFFVDYENRRLYIGSNPVGKLVEVSVFSQAMRILADETVVRGLGFAHFAGSRLEGMVQVDNSDRVRLENNTFAWAASRGLAIYRGEGAVIRGNNFLNNGLLGLAAWSYDNVMLEDNRFSGNNIERFVMHGEFADAAGAKITVGKNWIIRDNQFIANHATGLWLDISNFNTAVVHNRVEKNDSHGIYYEISAKAIIASNIVVENASGIRISNSSYVRVFNNTLVRNLENVSIQDDRRTNSDANSRALGITHITGNIELKNNIFANGQAVDRPLLWVRDYNSIPRKTAGQMVSDADFNAYYREDTGKPAQMFSWWSMFWESGYDNLDEFQRATGHEENGMTFDGEDVNPFFPDLDDRTYTLRPDSPAKRAGSPLPEDVAHAIGVAAGVPVDLGALPGPKNKL